MSLPVFAHFNAAATRIFIVSGAASNATFAVTGVVTTDHILWALRCEGGNGAGPTAVLCDGAKQTEVTIPEDGAMKTPLTATNADTLIICVHDVSVAEG